MFNIHVYLWYFWSGIFFFLHTPIGLLWTIILYTILSFMHGQKVQLFYTWKPSKPRYNIIILHTCANPLILLSDGGMHMFDLQREIMSYEALAMNGHVRHKSMIVYYTYTYIINIHIHTEYINIPICLYI
jgi:hypothetical protein